MLKVQYHDLFSVLACWYVLQSGKHERVQLIQQLFRSFGPDQNQQTEIAIHVRMNSKNIYNIDNINCKSYLPGYNPPEKLSLKNASQAIGASRMDVVGVRVKLDS